MALNKPDVLTPEFVAAIPGELVKGEALKYRRESDGRFVRYSVGWNGTDDGGQVAISKSGGDDLEHGDWVWQYPAK